MNDLLGVKTAEPLKRKAGRPKKAQAAKATVTEGAFPELKPTKRARRSSEEIEAMAAKVVDLLKTNGGPMDYSDIRDALGFDKKDWASVKQHLTSKGLAKVKGEKRGTTYESPTEPAGTEITDPAATAKGMTTAASMPVMNGSTEHGPS